MHSFKLLQYTCKCNNWYKLWKSTKLRIFLILWDLKSTRIWTFYYGKKVPAWIFLRQRKTHRAWPFWCMFAKHKIVLLWPKQHFYLVISSPEMQRRLRQTKVHYKLFYSFRIEKTHKLSKVAGAETFLQYVCYGCNLLRWMLFIPYDYWKTLLFIKVYLEIFSTAILLLS